MLGLTLYEIVLFAIAIGVLISLALLGVTFQEFLILFILGGPILLTLLLMRPTKLRKWLMRKSEATIFKKK